MRAVELQLVLRDELLQFSDELSAEDAAQHRLPACEWRSNVCYLPCEIADTIPCARLLPGNRAGALYQLHSLAPARNSFHRSTHYEIDGRQQSVRASSDAICISPSAERLIFRRQNAGCAQKILLTIFFPWTAWPLIYSIRAVGNYSASSIAPASVLISKGASERHCFHHHPVIVRHTE